MVELPLFDFTTKNRGGYRKLKVDKKSPIIITGLFIYSSLQSTWTCIYYFEATGVVKQNP